jgi:hypothetical protein
MYQRLHIVQPGKHVVFDSKQLQLQLQMYPKHTVIVVAEDSMHRSLNLHLIHQCKVVPLAAAAAAAAAGCLPRAHQ